MNSEIMDVIFYVREDGNLNFRVNGQYPQSHKRILSRKDIPEWAIRKAKFYYFLMHRYGTCVSFDCGYDILRCAFITSFDDTQEDLIESGMGTFYHGQNRQSPPKDFYISEIKKDISEFSEYKIDDAQIRIHDSLESYLSE